MRATLPNWNLAGGVAALGLLLGAPSLAQAQTKVACVGEQTTHSLHRENDPEYPEMMAKLLDVDFVAGPKMAPHGGGFLEGGGTNFTVGNFGHPQASVLNHNLENPKTYLKSEEFTLLVAFQPKIVVLGPFGDHEELSLVDFANFPADMKALVDALLAIPSKPVVAMATPLPEGGLDNSAPYRQINQDSKAAATEYKLPVIDLWSEFLSQTTLFQDATHLTLPGRQHLASFVADAVKQIDLGLKNPDPSGGGGSGGGANGGGTGGAVVGGGGGSGGVMQGPGPMPVVPPAPVDPAPSSTGGTSTAASAPADSGGCALAAPRTKTDGLAGLFCLLGIGWLLRRRPALVQGEQLRRASAQAA